MTKEKFSQYFTDFHLRSFDLSSYIDQVHFLLKEEKISEVVSLICSNKTFPLLLCEQKGLEFAENFLSFVLTSIKRKGDINHQISFLVYLNGWYVERADLEREVSTFSMLFELLISSGKTSFAKKVLISFDNTRKLDRELLFFYSLAINVACYEHGALIVYMKKKLSEFLEKLEISDETIADQGFSEKDVLLIHLVEDIGGPFAYSKIFLQFKLLNMITGRKIGSCQEILGSIFSLIYWHQDLIIGIYYLSIFGRYFDLAKMKAFCENLLTCADKEEEESLGSKERKEIFDLEFIIIKKIDILFSFKDIFMIRPKHTQLDSSSLSNDCVGEEGLRTLARKIDEGHPIFLLNEQIRHQVLVHIKDFTALLLFIKEKKSAINLLEKCMELKVLNGSFYMDLLHLKMSVKD